MRRIVFILFSSLQLFAIPLNISSFSSDFEQFIVDDQNKTIRYKGDFLAKVPNLALWNYRDPIVKQVLIKGSEVTVIEPDLEQAIKKQVEKDFDFFGILEKALYIEEGHYEASYDYRSFSIYLSNKQIAKIVYLDDFDNTVTINFINPRQNIPIEDERFVLPIPEGYDIIED